MDEKKFAVLIDADNVSYKYAELIFREASNFGNVKIKKIYGDWSKAELAPWKDIILDYSIYPVQQFNYTTGKNSTDSAILIDAMDILFQGSVDGFCIVTSDSDFTRLVSRLRESDMYVVGMGERKTPTPLVKACSEFKYLDVLRKNEKNEKAKQKTKAKTTKKTTKAVKKNEVEEHDERKNEEVKLEEDKGDEGLSDEYRKEKLAIIDIMKEIFEANLAERGEWLEISFLDTQIKKRKPDFDFRIFGLKKMVQFFEALEPYGIIVKRVLDESNHKNPSHKIYIGITDE